MQKRIENDLNNIQPESELSNARSPYCSFELPTGFLDKNETDASGNYKVIKDIELREITGDEEDMLAAKGMNSNQRINNLMVGCLVRVGKYTEKNKIREIVLELVSNDRFFVVYKIREISLGKEYRFKAPCPHCSDDKLRIVDLSEVKFPSLKDPQKRIYEGVLPKSQINYKWAVQTGKTEEKLQKVLQAASNNLFSALIAQRLVELGGRPSSIQDVKKLVALDRQHLRKEFEEVEGLLDDNITVDCPVCGNEFDVEVDIGHKEFFFPTA